jgi:radical SAM protein with 4Fe4S-binding SPASM domain
MKTCRLLGKLAPRYRNLEIGVNTVLCSKNSGFIDRTRALVGRLDSVRTHTVSLIRGNVGEPSLKNVDPETYRVATEVLPRGEDPVRRMSYRFAGARLKEAQDILQRRSILRAMNTRRRETPCYAGRINLVLTEQGDVYPCESFDSKMGNVREEGWDVRKLLRRDDARAVLDNIRKKKCWCTHECYHMTNIFFNPAMYPRLLREYLRLAGPGRRDSPVPVNCAARDSV